MIPKVSLDLIGPCNFITSKLNNSSTAFGYYMIFPWQELVIVSIRSESNLCVDLFYDYALGILVTSTGENFQTPGFNWRWGLKDCNFATTIIKNPPDYFFYNY